MTEQSSPTPVLIAVDWGSSNFRAFLLDKRGKILSEVSAPQGMLCLKKDEFEAALLAHIQPWVTDFSVPVLMAGMVGSAQGWVDAGYIDCPADAKQAAMKLCHVDNESKLSIRIVPGVKCQTANLQPDVMRGEEVQVFGAVSLIEHELGLLNNAQLDKLVFCLPGTHSKWIKMAKNDQGQPIVESLSTQMTGEMYNIVVENSILGKGVYKQATDVDMDSFLQGVHTSQREGGLLHHLFSARTLRLEQRLDDKHVCSYISGLLIGAELCSVLAASSLEHIYLIGSSTLNTLYAQALKELGLLSTPVSSEKASALGMVMVAEQANLIKSKEVH
ncbi:hypothetical protein BCU94_16695 [Shewanella sp. 10N.286.52.C2]|uniref:2-dehydro-3-deoxygalactonokinase n=1 Tax=Shewanella sp. 10N.286.52.C2 TaxID=1880838 RepID=UPI000C845B05|nr:2-dehydro-3-deoxygalactonokinase [Shewanella sp. 10N.286.52.C2]PMG28337.1 hypothetical protein BCU94_16695 [Shewanella sp. 10N.286.52.C2]